MFIVATLPLGRTREPMYLWFWGDGWVVVEGEAFDCLGKGEVVGGELFDWGKGTAEGVCEEVGKGVLGGVIVRALASGSVKGLQPGPEPASPSQPGFLAPASHSQRQQPQPPRLTPPRPTSSRWTRPTAACSAPPGARSRRTARTCRPPRPWATCRWASGPTCRRAPRYGQRASSGLWGTTAAR